MEDVTEALSKLIGDGVTAPCVDGSERPYLSLDAAASTSAMGTVVASVEKFLPSYSSVHRGAGYTSQFSTGAYEAAREAAIGFAGRRDGRDTAIICRNTTEAINHLAFRMQLNRDDVVVTTVVEHHANLLPWRRYATCRYVECDATGVFTVDAIAAALDERPRPALLAVTGASNITGWCPDVDAIVTEAHARSVPVFVDGAQLAPHRPLPAEADFVAWSGHKMYAPFGAGILVGPTEMFRRGEPFLAGGGAVDLVDLDEVLWTEPPEREEAGSPNVIGAVALHAAIDEIGRIGWEAIREHDSALARRLHTGLVDIPGVRLLGPAGRLPGPAGRLPGPAGRLPGPAGRLPGPGSGPTSVPDLLPVATFTVEGMHHGLVAARLSAEHAIGVRHGCFCAHPYIVRLLGLSPVEVDQYRNEVRRGDRHRMPGALRASAGLSTTAADVDRFLDALERIAGGEAPPVEYSQDPTNGEYFPDPSAAPWYAGGGVPPACGRS